MHILNYCQPLVSAIPAAYILLDYYSTRHSRSLIFCSCGLR